MVEKSIMEIEEGEIVIKGKLLEVSLWLGNRMFERFFLDFGKWRLLLYLKRLVFFKRSGKRLICRSFCIKSELIFIFNFYL